MSIIPVMDTEARRFLQGNCSRCSSKKKTNDRQHIHQFVSEFKHIPIQAVLYQESFIRNLLFYCLSLCTCGLLLLVSVWYSIFSFKCRRRQCTRVKDAQFVLIKSLSGEETLRRLESLYVREQDVSFAVNRLSTAMIPCPQGVLGQHFSYSLSPHSDPIYSTTHPTQEKNQNFQLFLQQDIQEIDPWMYVYSFEFHCKRFIYIPTHGGRFINVEFDIEEQTISNIWGRYGVGIYSPTISDSRRKLFGPCEVIVPLKSSWEIAASECIQPFYIFQLCSIALWFCDTYYYYATAVAVLSAVTLFASIRETCKNNRNLHAMARFVCDINVLRKPSHGTTDSERLDEIYLGFLNHDDITDYFQTIPSTHLVPGDIFALSQNMKLPCDVILLSGTALVDESMMTGESKPVYKTSLILRPFDHTERFDSLQHAKHILFGGSEVRDCNGSKEIALCLVMNTGFSTVQGNMLRSLVYPSTVTRLDFEKETWKFVALLASLSCFTFGWSLYRGIENGLNVETIVKRALDTITIAVPPALPIIVTVGMICALNALKVRHHCQCLMPSRINVAGRANVVVFDKTGTLTEDDEDLLAIIPVYLTTNYHKLSLLSTHLSELNADHGIDPKLNDSTLQYPQDKTDTNDILSSSDSHLYELGTPKSSPNDLTKEFIMALASCHSLGFVDNVLIGDPLEYQMLNFSNWRLIPPKKNIVDHPIYPTRVEDVQLTPHNTNDSLSNSCDTTLHSNLHTDQGKILLQLNNINPDLYIGLCPNDDSFESQELWSLKDIDSCASSNHTTSSCLGSSLRNSPNKKLNKYDITSTKESITGIVPSGQNQQSNCLKYFEYQEYHGGCMHCPVRMESPRLSPVLSSIASKSQFQLETRELIILKVFQFDANLQRMSVLVQHLKTGCIKGICKGSPERIYQLCSEESRPNNFSTIISEYALKGLRVLAIGEKVIYSPPKDPLTPNENLKLKSLDQIERDDVECNLRFLGLLLFTNLLRSDTSTAIAELHGGGSCLYMATGDGSVTAAAIGIEAGLLPKKVESLILGQFQHSKDRDIVWTVQPFSSHKNVDIPSLTKSENHSHIIKESVSPLKNNKNVLYKNEKFNKKQCITIDENETASGTPRSEESDFIIRESKSLLQVMEGRRLSSVGLAITGEAFRFLAAAPQNSQARALDRFRVDAFRVVRGSRSPFCCGGVCIAGGTEDTGLKLWDKKPREMDTFEFVLRYFQIFSRMSPDDKALLVQKLQGLPNQPIVAMCGDGANDCAALKVADVGVSLSSREASVAAPFNSAKKTIRVVVDVLKEGRGALTNSIQNFQFVALYALIQLCAVTLLGNFGCNLADGQYLYLDLIVVMPLTYFMAWSKCNNSLKRTMPPDSLLAWSITASVLGQIAIQGVFQAVCLFKLLRSSAIANFYTIYEVKVDEETNVASFENTVVFLVSNVQTVVIAVILSFGTRPWKAVSRNIGFLLVAKIFTIVGFALILNQASYMAWLRDLLSLMPLPLTFRVILLAVVTANVIVSIAFEEICIRRGLRKFETRKDKKALNREAQRDFGVEEEVLADQNTGVLGEV